MKVVRGDVGELLQLDVGARQLFRLPLQRAVGVYRLGVQQRVGERPRHLRAYHLRRFHVARRVGGARQRAEVERAYHHVLVDERRAQERAQPRLVLRAQSRVLPQRFLARFGVEESRAPLAVDLLGEGAGERGGVARAPPLHPRADGVGGVEFVRPLVNQVHRDAVERHKAAGLGGESGVDVFDLQRGGYDPANRGERGVLRG